MLFALTEVSKLVLRWLQPSCNSVVSPATQIQTHVSEVKWLAEYKCIYMFAIESKCL